MARRVHGAVGVASPPSLSLPVAGAAEACSADAGSPDRAASAACRRSRDLRHILTMNHKQEHTMTVPVRLCVSQNNFQERGSLIGEFIQDNMSKDVEIAMLSRMHMK